MTPRDARGDDLSPASSGASLTPRQAEVLDLARVGLSDDEIAVRLRVSPRRVRYLFETVFEELGVRDRLQALTVWSGSTRQPVRLLDRCPYPRPFATGFADCPAYRAVRVATLRGTGGLSGTMWTCRHLEPRPLPESERDAGWYAGCAIGGPAAREAWAIEGSGPERLKAMNQVAEDLAELTGPVVERLFELKGRQRQAIEREQDASPITAQMERVREGFLTELAAFLQARHALLVRNRLSAAACLDVARRAIDGLLAPQLAAGWNIRFEILLGLPAEAWLG